MVIIEINNSLLKYFVQCYEITENEDNDEEYRSENRPDLYSVEELVNDGADVNIADIDGWTPLMYSAFYNDTEIAKYLIDKGVSLDEITNNHFNETAVMLAVRCCNEATVKLLIENGADITIPNKEKKTPLIFTEEMLEKVENGYIKKQYEKILEHLKNAPNKLEKQFSEIEWDKVYVI